MTADVDEILTKVKELLYRCQRIPPEKVEWAYDLNKDLGISGDDSDFLFLELNKLFKVNWTGLNLAVHFGSEATLLPFPWSLGWMTYKRQPFRLCVIL